MKEDIDLDTLNAFVDGELGFTRQLAVEKAIEQDARLRARIESLRELRRQVHDQGDYHVAPDALRSKIEAMTRSASDVRRPDPAVRPGPWSTAGVTLQRWWGWRPLTTAFAATMAISFGVQFYLAHEQQDNRLADEVVASHVRSTLGPHMIDVASSDHHTVKPYLSSKLDFSPPVRDAQIGSAVFVGGRVDYLDGRPVAALVYRQGEHVVNAFIWPGPTVNTRASFSSDRGYQIAHWTRDGMTHWMISDVNPTEFMNLVNLIASTPD